VEYELNKAHIRYALYIPANFSTDLENNKKVNVRLVLHPANDPIEIDRVQRNIEKAVISIAMLDTLDDSLNQLKLMQSANPDTDIYFSEERINQQVESQKESAETRPLVVVVETTPTGMDEAEETTIPPFGQVVVAGFAVLFVFLSAQNTAQSIFDEKRIGSFRRLTAAPISKAGLLFGKLLPNLLMTLVQIFIIFLTGIFLIPLVGLPSIDFSSDPFGLFLASVAIALCSTSLGILIAAIAQSEGQVGGLSSALLWVAGFLGGSIVPAFMFPDSLQAIAKFVPHYWANQAYFDLIFRGETLATVWPSLLVLCAFTAIFFLIGVWRFDFD
jgi:ABC-type multidrug transport system permease subunit